MTLTEECFQRTHLQFATEQTEIRYVDNHKPSVLINATTTSVGTFPKGSQWRRNPVPMCNCDQGIGCDATDSLSAENPSKPYPKSYGIHDARCPTGVQFEPLFDQGYGVGLYPHALAFTMVDKLQLPELEAGEYALSWRWDCEETPQGMYPMALEALTVRRCSLELVQRCHNHRRLLASGIVDPDVQLTCSAHLTLLHNLYTTTITTS